MNIKIKKQSILIITFVFVFSITLGIAVPKKSEAQFLVSDIMLLAERTQDTIWERVQNITRLIWNKTGSVALHRAFQSFSNQLAYKAATQIATGKAGGGVAWFTQLASKEAENAGKAAGAEFLDNLASSFGINICEPPTANLKFNLAIGLKQTQVAGELKPRCSLDEMKKKWGDFASQLRNPLSIISLNDASLMDVLASQGVDMSVMGIDGKQGTKLTDQQRRQLQAKLIAKSISFEDSDVSYINDVSQATVDAIEKTAGIATSDRNANNGATGIRKTITGDLVTPAMLSEQQLLDITKRNEEAAKLRTDDIIVDSANIFMNTLVSKSLEKLMQNLMKSNVPQIDLGNLSEGTYSNNQRLSIVDEIFSTINRISININPREINLISELEMDLGDEFIGKMNNKTIDAKFADVLRRSETEPLTLQEAITQNLIDEDKYFGYIDIAGSKNQPTLDQGYSYDNIKILRKNRIVPVGWEFAAMKIYQLTPDKYPEGCDAKGCKLRAVMKGYNETGSYKKGDLTINDNFCGLRSLDLYPDLSSVVNSTNCTLNSSVTGLTVTSTISRCYQYNTDSEGVVVSTTIVTNVNTLVDCENVADSSAPGYYRKWVPGGCFAVENNESPFCHLVDPNWILKAPKQICAAEGYYSALESTDSSNRYKDCADTQNCLKEDDNGGCLGYGYCLKEKNIWKFRGKKCDEKSAGCTTIKDDAGKTKSYILDTLKTCPQDEAGCKQYSNWKSDLNTVHNIENYAWASTTYTYLGKTSSPFNYFNTNISSCDSSNEGCSKFVEIVPGLNLVPNPSFEIDENDNNIPDGWTWNSGSGFISTSTQSFDGRYSVMHSGGESVLKLDISNSSFNILSKGLYTLSYRVRGDGAVTPRLIYKLNNVVTTTINMDAGYSATGTDWNMKSGYFGIDNPNNYTLASSSIEFVIIGSVYIDAVQFELNSYDPSNIKTGVGNPTMYNNYGEKGVMYMKKAPDYYNCNYHDSSRVKSPSCSNYSRYCTKEDVGCEAYKPTNGDQDVVAVVSQGDLCPSQCNNYQTFSQYPSYFEYIESESATPALSDINFIPESATDCSPSQDSCEVFTNVDKASKGGEAKEYYSYLRQCVKPTDNVINSIYYTWEGSDTSGFQLKTWRLLSTISDGSGAPCTNVGIGTNNCVDMDVSAEDTNVISECNPNLDLDCRVFYDNNAKAYTRLLSRTIPITDECIDLRRDASTNISGVVYKAVPSMSTKCSAKSVGCRRYKGNKGDNTRVAFFGDFESAAIEPGTWTTDNGSLKPSTESIAYNGHSMLVDPNNTDTVYIEYDLTHNGKTLIPGKKYSLEFWAKRSKSGTYGFTFNTSNLKSLLGKLNPIKSFIASAATSESDGNTTVDGVTQIEPFSLEFINTGIENNQLELANSAEWLRYRYNDVVLEQSTTGGYILKFSIYLPSFQNYDVFFIDNVSLKEITSDFYKIKDSWTTPKVCSDGAGYLGCEQYSDRDNNPWYFSQFTNTCKEENIGCSGMIDTKNSEMPFKQTYNAYCNSGTCIRGKNYYQNYSNVEDGNRVSSTIEVATDQLVYMVKERKNLCTSSNKGCSAFGFKGDDGKYQDVYKMNNPDSYIQDDYYGSGNKILCLSEFSDCTAFSLSEGGKVYKIHPRDRVCEYKEEENTHPAGYYEVNNPNISCDTKIYNENYNLFVNKITKSDDNWLPFGDFNNNYSLSCSNSQNKCSMFIDPTDVKNMSVESSNIIDSKVDLSRSWMQTSWQNDYRNGVYVGGAEFGNVGIGAVSYSEKETSFRMSTENTLVYNALVYKDPRVGIDKPFNFLIKKEGVYKLSASVKFDGENISNKERISTFLSCGPSDYAGKIDYLKGGASGTIPYAFPFMKSTSLLEENDNAWHQIYGLYKMLPGAKYCNVAFYINGRGGSLVKLKDIKFEEVTGDYYYIDNSELDRTSCSKANFEDGCILFNNTSKSGFSYNASASYENGSLVGNNPEYSNDSNELLKVIRDRECGEWDTCSSKVKTISNSGEEKYSCTSLIACNKLSLSADCYSYIEKDQNAKPLNLKKYYDDTGLGSWSDMSYSGYSIPGNYSPELLSVSRLTQRNLDGEKGPNYSYQLGRVITKGSNKYIHSIGVSDPLSYNSSFKIASTDKPVSKSCRLYPEKDSPFTWTKNNEMGVTFDKYSPANSNGYVIATGKDSKFTNANICQPLNGTGTPEDKINNILLQGESCECSYTKANYGLETLYLPYNQFAPSSIEVGSGDSTSTLKLKNSSKNSGWNGFCLDYDKSLRINTDAQNSRRDDISLNYRCSMWYPVDVVGGETDTASLAPSADIVSIIPDGSKICLTGKDYVTPEDRYYCGRFNHVQGENESQDVCNVIVYVPRGSKINMDFVRTNTSIASQLLDNGWLSSGNFVTSTISASTSLGISMDYSIIHILNPKDVELNNSDDHQESTPFNTYKFHRSDFSGVTYSTNVTLDIDRLFDASSSGNTIKKYVFDESVKWTNDGNFGITNTDSMFWIASKMRPYDNYNVLGDVPGWGALPSCLGINGHQISRLTVDGNGGIDWSQVMVGAAIAGPLGAYYDAAWQAFIDSVSRTHMRFCNPLLYNYYINQTTGEYAYLAGMGTPCGTKCAKTCDISAVIDKSSGLNKTRTVFKADNAYLTGVLSKEDFSSGAYPCSFNVCSQIYSGDINAYNNLSLFRGNETYYSNGFHSMLSMFGLSRITETPSKIIWHKPDGKQDIPYLSGYSGFFGNDSNIIQAGGNLVFLIKKIFYNDTQSITNSGTTNPPSITSVKLIDGKPTQGQDGFSINGAEVSTDLEYSINQNVDISFFASAAGNSTPLQEIKISWNGDDKDMETMIFQGPFKNHKNKCERRCGVNYVQAFANSGGLICTKDNDCSSLAGANKCFSKTWGDREEACIDDTEKNVGSFNFSHIYTCSPLSSSYDPITMRCVYKPYIKVTDNWNASTIMHMCGINDNCAIIVYPE